MPGYAWWCPAWQVLGQCILVGACFSDFTVGRAPSFSCFCHHDGAWFLGAAPRVAVLLQACEGEWRRARWSERSPLLPVLVMDQNHLRGVLAFSCVFPLTVRLRPVVVSCAWFLLLFGCVVGCFYVQCCGGLDMFLTNGWLLRVGGRSIMLRGIILVLSRCWVSSLRGAFAAWIVLDVVLGFLGAGGFPARACRPRGSWYRVPAHRCAA